MTKLQAAKAARELQDQEAHLVHSTDKDLNQDKVHRSTVKEHSQIRDHHSMDKGTRNMVRVRKQAMALLTTDRNLLSKGRDLLSLADLNTAKGADSMEPASMKAVHSTDNNRNTVRDRDHKEVQKILPDNIQDSTEPA